MYKLFMSWAILSLLSLNLSAYAADSAITGPTEVGTTTMTPGQYAVIDQNSGAKYSLTVTTKGTMILGPAPATAASKASGLEGLAESQMKRSVTNMVEKQGMSEMKGLIK
jgi:hypothetical protein